MKLVPITVMATMGLACGLLVAPAAYADPSAPGAPSAVRAVRDSGHPNDFTVNWKAPVSTSGAAAVDHYDVSVLAGASQHVQTVPATARAVDVTGVDYSTAYRIVVTSRNAEGHGLTSSPWSLDPVLPGAPAHTVGNRGAADPTTATVSWAAPARPGYSPVTGYRVSLTRTRDHATSTVTTTSTSFTYSGLSTARTYSIAVQALTADGVGASAGAYIGNEVPSAPLGFTAVRDPANPTRVLLHWAAPAYTGMGAITGYQVGYGKSVERTYLSVTGCCSASLPLPLNAAGYYTVRALNSHGASFRAPDVNVGVPGTAGSPPLPTRTHPIVISANAGAIFASYYGWVGSPGASRLVLRITPSGATTYRDEVWAMNGSAAMVYRTVPNGTYQVTVSGLDQATAAETLLASTNITVGVLGPNDWTVVSGYPKISRAGIDFAGNGETRVLDSGTSSNATVATIATLNSGNGYGVWLRASFTAGTGIDGYSFQVDPGFSNKFILRHFYRNVECATPLAQAPFPRGYALLGVPHAVIVSIQGDSLTASIDGMPALTVPSLSAALAAEPCHMPAPTGTRIGFRSWSAGSSSFRATSRS